MLTRNQILIIGAIGLAVLFFLLIFLGVIPGLKPSVKSGGSGGGPKIQLNFWGVENYDVLRPILDSYSNTYGVQIAYTQFNEDTFEKSLIDALASGQGPDILSFHNNWLPKHSGKIAPIPANANFPVIQVRNLFPQIVENDFISDGKIYALPIYIDTLVFLYNRDFFDSKGIAVLPKSWTEFQNIIPTLKEIDAFGRITRAAAAIGGSQKSVDKASDLLSLLMLQFGVEMNIPNSIEVNFYRDQKSALALNYYLQFADSGNQNYTWNDNLRYSLDNFVQEETAAIFNYASALPFIKSKNPFLNVQINPMLQFSQDSVNYADYWGLAVSNQSKKQLTAWNFILYLSSNASAAEQYLQASKRPPALRSLIQKYINDPDLGIFARQALTAKSWKQKDSVAVRKIFSNMIESVLRGELGSDKALQRAESEINGL